MSQSGITGDEAYWDARRTALAEAINGTYKAECVDQDGPFRQPRRRQERHCRLGPLVQQPPTSRQTRLPATSRSRNPVLSHPTSRPTRRHPL